MAVSFPAANGRHEHEWKIWREVKLPAGKVIVPGVIDSTVNTVEHPDVVADRILNFAGVAQLRRFDPRFRNLGVPSA
jgi:5-methyltetrahydropteroyltriglutamate--homocysteine methyltransferase